MSKPSDMHMKELSRLIGSLNAIDEDPSYIDLVMRESLWTPESNSKMKKFPDLILLCKPNGNDEYAHGHGVVIELKSNGSKMKRHAVKQMCNGKIYVETRLRMPVPYGKLVKYDGGGDFTYEEIAFTDFFHDISEHPEFPDTKKFKIILDDISSPRISLGASRYDRSR